MKTATENKKQSLLSDAFRVLLKNLGPEKTAHLWRIFVSSKTDYRIVRDKLFADKTLASLYAEAKKFNRGK